MGVTRQAGTKCGARGQRRQGFAPGLALSLLLGTGLGVLTGLPALAQTQAATTTYNIAPQSLSSALVAFSRTSGLQLFVSADIVRGRTSPGATGQLTEAQALDRLLSGSGLSYRISGNAATISDGSGGGAPVAQDGSIVLEEVNVTAWVESAAVGWDGSAETVYSTPASVAHISEERIQTFRGSSVGDFLSGTPGVLNGDNRNSGALDVNVRGMQGFGRVPVVIDGSQQQNTVYRGYAGVANRTYIDPDLIGGVSIEKGPGSGVHGVGATGGLAVMKTISADDILRDGQDFGVRVIGGIMGNTSEVPPVRTKGGVQPPGAILSFGYYYYATPPADFQNLISAVADKPGLLEPTAGHGSVALAAQGDNYEFVAAYARRKQGNYHAGTEGGGPVAELFPTQGMYRVNFPEINRYERGGEVFNTSQDNTSYLGKFTVRGGDGHSLELSYRRYESDFGEVMPSILIDGGPMQSHLSRVEADALAARYQWNPADNDLINLKANLWTTRTQSNITSAYDLYGFIFYDAEFKSLENRTGIDISNESVFETAAGRIALQYGGSYTHETSGPSSEPFVSTVRYAARDGWREESSAFVAGQWEPLDWLTLNGGLRYTTAYAYDNSLSTVPSGPLAGTQLHNEESGSGFAPSASVTVEPFEGWQVYGRYAEAIRIASLFESTRADGPTSWSYDPAPLYDIAPERAKTWEIGTNLSFDDVIVDGDKLGVKLAYFDNHVDDYQSRIYLFSAPPGMPNSTIVNIDHATFRGIELSANYDAGGFFAELGGTYYTDVEFCVTATTCYAGGVPNGYVNNNIPPKFAASATLGVRLFEEKLTLGGRITHMGERATDYVNVGGSLAPVIWKPYTLVDVFASYEVSEDVRLDFSIDNVGDIYYLDTLTLGYQPSPGRTFRASMTAKF